MKSLILILATVCLFSVEPIIKVPDLPSDESLEAFELTEEIFTVKVMEYYNIAKTLESQIKLLGYKPIEDLKNPSYEELTDLELDVIVKFYNIAKSYEAQLYSSSGLDQNEEIVALKRQLLQERSRSIDTIWNIQNSYLQREIKIKEKADSACNARLKEIEESLNNGCPDCVNYLSVAITQNLFLPDAGDELTAEPNTGLKIYLNALKIFGFGGKVNFWYEYQSPRFFTDFSPTNQNLRWNSEMSAVGISGDFYPLKLVELRNGIKAGLGYFWSSGSIYNLNSGNFAWEGLKFDLEYFIGTMSSKYPLEVFLGLNLYQSTNSDLNFNYQDDQIYLGRTHAGIYAGIRYNFWTQAF